MCATHFTLSLTALLLLLPIVSACRDVTSGDTSADDDDTFSPADSLAIVVPSESGDQHLLIGSDSYSPVILLDGSGNMSHSLRPLLRGNKLLTTHYQRVGCEEDTCRQEWVTFTAIQYPREAVLQAWVGRVIGRFYSEATRSLDIMVNGERSEMNDEGEMVLLNTGCPPYEGSLDDEGKAMFDYYRARVWALGKERGSEHGPSGRYGCVLYRCWQSPEVVTCFVAYSTDVQQPPEHYTVSFDRRTGKELSFADIIKDDNVAELNDLVADASRQRHFELLHKKDSDLAVEKHEADYSSLIGINHVAFVDEGLAVCTGALPFDQWSHASHILVIPYEKVNYLLVERFRR